MAIAIRGLTGEDEAVFAEEAARGTPVLALLMQLLHRVACDEAAPAVDADAMTAGEAQALALHVMATSVEGPIRPAFACTACGETLSLTLDPLDLVAAPPARGQPTAITIEGVALACRAATVADLLAAAHAAEPRAAAMAVLERCVTGTDAEGRALAIGALPPHLAEQAAEHVLALDPQAETVLACSCPGCGAAVEAVIDPAQFLMAELARQRRTLLVDVLAIAARTGWTEASILAMPRLRRRGYAAALGAA